MARIPLSETGGWHLRFDEQDIRGFEAVGERGERLGRTVEDLILDTDAERVATVVLDDGTEVDADDVSIGDGVVYLTQTPHQHASPPSSLSEEQVATARTGGTTERRPFATEAQRRAARKDFDAASYASLREEFLSHHARAYNEAGRSYEDVEPAYRYGYERAHDDPFRERTYRDAEADLLTGFGERHPDRPFDEVREAVREGYLRAQRGVRRLTDDTR